MPYPPPSPERPQDPALVRLEAVLRGVGDVARSFHGRVTAEYKDDGSPVTEADLAVQQALVEGLAIAFPEDGVLSEEGERRRPEEGGGTWFVDPIDGTGAFLQGLAHWGPTVCRVDASGRLDVGAYYEPLLDRMFSAGAGLGAWRNGVRLPVAPTTELRSDDILFVPSRIHRRPGLPWSGKLRALGSTAAHLALLAAGGGRGAIVARWSMWDVGCGVLMNREVGHLVRSPDGRPFEPAVSSEGLPFLVGAHKALDILDTGGWASSQMPSRRT
jgi:myo-inositol-1(or 4)-monophosphatase